MHTFNIGEAISGGIKAATKKAGPLLLTFLVAGAINFGVQYLLIGDISTVSSLEEINPAKIGLAGLINLIVGIFIGVAALTISLDAVFNREFSFSNITKNFSRIPQLILAGILIALMSLVNIIPVLGWIAFAVIYFMIIQSPLLIVDQKLSAIESFKKSKQLMEGNKLRMLGLLIIVVIVSMVISLATVVLGPIGPILTSIVIGPFSVCIMAHVYKQLTQGPVATATEKVKQAVS